MERATKLFVALWTCAALAAVVFFIRPGWAALPELAVLSFTVAAIATALDRRAVGIVLLFAYVFPIVVRTVTHVNYPPNGAVWTAGLLGAIVPDALRSRWRIAGRWRAAVVTWALIVVVSATIVCLREFDFTTALLSTKLVPNSSIGGWPSMQAAWALHVAVVLLTGILWFDWLHALDRQTFTRMVAVPLAASCAITVAVALYQLFVDVTFLNPTVYGAMARATGMVMDGNVLGTIAALWIGGWLLLADVGLTPDATIHADRAGSGFSRIVTGLVMPLACWLTVWASGSRTALGAAIVVTLFSAWAVLARDRARPPDRRRIGPKTAVAAVVALAAIAVFATAAPTRVIGPLYRLRMMAPGGNSEGAKAALAELWQRNGYGTIADVMIRAQPVAGVGIGGFQIMQPDFAKLAGLMPLPADNAQNWFRHQLVEFGLVGGVGWIAWLLTFGAFVVRGRSGEPPAARIARGMIVAFAAISLLGMPGQDVSAAVTFWTAAFWYVAIVDGPAARPISPRMWLAIAVVVGAYGAITAWQARTTFRVAVRAQRVGWPYSYGLYPGERDAAGGQQFRWTGDHAVAVIDAPTPHLLLTITPNPLAARRPLGVRVDVDRHTAIDEEVRSAQPIVKYVRLPAGEPRAMLETYVSRTFRPADAGLADTRELGLMLQWRFLPAEPAPEGALPQ